MNECIFIYRTYHLLSHGGLQCCDNKNGTIGTIQILIYAYITAYMNLSKCLSIEYEYFLLHPDIETNVSLILYLSKLGYVLLLVELLLNTNQSASKSLYRCQAFAKGNVRNRRITEISVETRLQN